MIQISLVECSGSEWTARISGYAGLSLMQTGAFGDAKSGLEGWIVERGLLLRDDKTIGVFQILIKTLPVIGGGLAWLNRGPLLADTGDCSTALTTLKRHYTDERGFYLRVAPAVQATDMGPFDAYEATGSPGWASAVLDLTPDIDDLRAGLRRNWRSHLNKAGRSQLEVSAGVEGAPYESFLTGYAAFINDLGLNTSVTPALITRLQESLPTEQRMRAYVCSLDGDVVAGVLIAGYGDTAEYIAAHSTDAGRKLGGGQLLLWQAITDAKKAGFSHFDLGGMDPDQTPPGIYKFKEGIGATPYRLAPEIEALGNTWAGLTARAVRWRVRRARRGS